MNKKKRVIAILLLLTMALSGCNGSKTVDKESSEGDPLPVYAKIEDPVADGMNFAIYMGPQRHTEEAYQRIRDCGIRTVYIDPWSGATINSDVLNNVLGYCEKAGLNAYILITQSSSEPEEYLSFLDRATVDYTKYPAFKGIYAFDEPSEEDIEWLAKDMERWESSIYKDYEYLVNISRYDLEGENTSEEHINTYWNKFLSKNDDNVLMYDCYPLWSKTEEGKVWSYVPEHVLQTLDAFAPFAKEHDSVFYGFWQTYSEKTGARRALVSVNDLRFQASFHMAYGMRGFTCFTYAQGSQFGDGAMITTSGEEAPYYYYVQEVIKELEEWEHVYLSFDWQGVMPITGKERGYGTVEKSQFKELKNTLKSHKRIDKIETEYDLLVGTFKDKDKNDGFLITSYTDPYYMKDNNIEVTFKDASKALVYHNGTLITNDKEKTCYTMDDGVLKFNLEAGDYLFVMGCVGLCGRWGKSGRFYFGSKCSNAKYGSRIYQ